jgi:hypothetical protein
VTKKTETTAAPEKASSNLPADIKAELEAARAGMAETIGDLPSNKISVKGKLFTLPGKEAQPGPLYAVILDYAWFNAFYKGAYNPQVPQQPVCFAVGRVEKKSDGTPVLAPDAKSPERQNDFCATCDKWQFGSAPGGGKACKNQRRLIIVGADATEDTQPLTLYVSPSGLKNFSLYLEELNSLGKHPAQVVTEIGFDPNQTYPKLTFKIDRMHDDLQLMWRLREKSQSMLFRTIDVAPTEAKAA